MSKNRGEIVDYKIKVILPNDKIKEVPIKNLNPLFIGQLLSIKIL